MTINGASGALYGHREHGHGHGHGHGYGHYHYDDVSDAVCSL